MVLMCVAYCWILIKTILGC